MKAALFGYGQMGQAIDAHLQALGHDVVLKASSGDMAHLQVADLDKVDTIIEFTAPEQAPKSIDLAFRAGKPIMVGTTGWYEHYDSLATRARAEGRCMLCATNCSLGMNVFFAVNAFLAKQMSSLAEYDASIVETHHTKKKDAPSGTAITLAEGIISHHQRYAQWGQREGQLPIESIRLGEVPGTHQINYHSAIDSITIRHTAHSRDGFVHGAVVAAQWIVGKTGVFSMNDILNIQA